MRGLILKSISLLVVISFSFILSGCLGSRNSNVYPGYKTITTGPSYNGSTQNRGGRSHKGVYKASLHVSGDLSFLDRKYLKSTLETKLEDRGINIEYNALNSINVRVTKNILDNRSSGGEAYQNCSAYKLDRRVTGTVEYIIRGKETYASSINYKFLVKSSSCVSYDDAERKARLLLIKKLGSVTASKIAKHKGMLKSGNNTTKCAIN